MKWPLSLQSDHMRGWLKMKSEGRNADRLLHKVKGIIWGDQMQETPSVH